MYSWEFDNKDRGSVIDDRLLEANTVMQVDIMSHFSFNRSRALKSLSYNLLRYPAAVRWINRHCDHLCASTDQMFCLVFFR